MTPTPEHLILLFLLTSDLGIVADWNADCSLLQTRVLECSVLVHPVHPFKARPNACHPATPLPLARCHQTPLLPLMPLPNDSRVKMTIESHGPPCVFRVRSGPSTLVLEEVGHGWLWVPSRFQVIPSGHWSGHCHLPFVQAKAGSRVY